MYKGHIIIDAYLLFCLLSQIETIVKLNYDM